MKGKDPAIWNFSRKELFQYIQAMIDSPLPRQRHALADANRTFRNLVMMLERSMGREFSETQLENLRAEAEQLRQDERMLRRELERKKSTVILQRELSYARLEYDSLLQKIHHPIPRTQSAQELLQTLANLENEIEIEDKKKNRLFSAYIQNKDLIVSKPTHARRLKDDYLALVEQ
jgi:hypothetical protein